MPLTTNTAEQAAKALLCQDAAQVAEQTAAGRRSGQRLR